MTEYLSLITPLILFIGVFIGHWLTLRSFGHLQPSAKDMAKQMEGTTSFEPDPWADTAEPIEPDAKLEEMFEKTGLPRESIDPTKFFGHDVGEEKEV